MGKYIGIDYGNDRLRAAVLEGDEAVLIPDARGNTARPAWVAVRGGEELLLGDEVKRAMLTEPLSLVSHPKAHLGTNDVYRCGGKDLFAPHMSAALLRQALMDAEAYLGEPVENAVVCMPASFTQAQRGALLQALAMSGVKRARLISDGGAAGMSLYIQEKSVKRILICDAGGNGFGATWLEVGEGIFEVVAQSHETGLGGWELNMRLADHLSKAFAAENGIDLFTDHLARQRLLAEAERVRIELSDRDEAKAFLPYIIADASGAKHLNANVSRQTLEDISRDLLERMTAIVRRTLADSGWSSADIDEVVLLGGLSPMPALAGMLERVTGRRPRIPDHPDSLAAKGAALMAGRLNGQLTHIVLLDALSRDIGFRTPDGKCHTLLEHNTTVPVLTCALCTTLCDGQDEMMLEIVERGDNDKDPVAVGTVRITGFSKLPAGQPRILIITDIDQDFGITVAAKDEQTGRVLPVESQGNLFAVGRPLRPRKEEYVRYRESPLRFGPPPGGKTSAAGPQDDHTGKTVKTETSSEESEGTRRVIEAVLPTLDNLRYALRAHRYSSDTDAIAKGVEMTLRGLESALASFGLKEIPAMGAPFDPTLHEAVEHGDDGRPGTVTEVYEKGYWLNGRIIRYAKVRVSK